MLYYSMSRIFIIVSILIAGCAQAPRVPVDVALIPNDCANRHAIVRWLETVLETDKSNESAIKARIWTLRYSCQPV